MFDATIFATRQPVSCREIEDHSIFDVKIDFASKARIVVTVSHKLQTQLMQPMCRCCHRGISSYSAHVCCISGGINRYRKVRMVLYDIHPIESE